MMPTTTDLALMAAKRSADEQAQREADEARQEAANRAWPDSLTSTSSSFGVFFDEKSTK